jgi:ATP-dependent DNA helicase RecG
MNISDLVKQKENRKLEFKVGLPAAEKFAKTACAFSNSQGGYLIVGLDDHGKVVGVDADKIVEYEEYLTSVIYDYCYPLIIPEIYTYTMRNKVLLVCQFYSSSQKPHYIKSKGKLNGTYVRLGSSNRLATEETLIALEREKRNFHFDSLIRYDYEVMEDQAHQLFNKLTIRLNQTGSFSFYEKLKLICCERDKYFLTNLGALFSEKKQSVFPYAKIECARFKGVKTEIFLDQATYDNDLVEAIEGAMEFIKRNIRLGATIGEIYRENKWEYPLLALREALINAVLHRDYSISGSDIKIAIFDDMLEITSPGVLMIDKEKLGFGYSELRNPHLGALFKRLEIIEQWGTGFNKIHSLMQDYPELVMEIDDESSFVQVRFIKNYFSQETAQENAETAQENAETAQENAETAQETAETAQETAQENTKKMVLELLRQNPKYTKSDLMRVLAKADGTIKEHIANLKKEGMLKRVGGTKSGHWVVTDE